MDPAKIKSELWLRGNLTWKLHKGQKAIYKDIKALSPEIREIVVLISRRWGKSYLGVLMALEDCLRAPGGQVFIVGPSLKQTRKIITPLIKEIIADAPRGLIKQQKSDISWSVGESTLLVGAFDTALEAFRGLRATSIYLEESGLADIEEYDYTLKSVLRPTLMHSRGKIYHLTTPPKEENHPFVLETLPEASLNKSLFVRTIRDNPLLSKKDIESEILIAGGESSPHCRRELFCEIVRDQERLIVPEFEENVHTHSLAQPSHANYLTSVDFGGVKDNHCALLCYYDFERNKTCVLSEVWLPINTGTSEIVTSVLEEEKKRKVQWLKGIPKRVTDAPGQTTVDLKRMGFECMPPEKGKDSVEDGIQALRVAFSRGQIEVSKENCPVLIQTLKYGMWNKHKTDFVRTDALGHCDALAALSYAFRHLDKRTNPFPVDKSKSADTHYITSTKSQQDFENEDAIYSAFYE